MKDFINLMGKDVYFENKKSRLQVYFSKETDADKIPKIVWEFNNEMLRDPIEVKDIKIKKILNIPAVKPGTFYIVNSEVMEVLKRKDLITPMIYNENKDAIYCKGFKRWFG